MKLQKLLVVGIAFFFMLLHSSQVQAVQVPSPLVKTEWLAQNISNVVVLDVRNGSAELAAFTTSGHIPGASLVNWAKVRATRVINGVTLTRMVPTKEDFSALMQASGVNQDSAVVITFKGAISDDVTMGTRLYWTLKYFGHDNVAVLNGGTSKWTKENREISTAPSAPAIGNYTATTERLEILATTDDVINAMKYDVNKNKYKEGKDIQLVDGRELNYYLGTAIKSYVYAGGHIPGSKNFPGSMMIEPDVPVTFVDSDLLLQAIKAMGIDPYGPAVLYCNSGHEVTGLWFFLHEIIGNKEVTLYDGSMHEWTMNSSRPVAYMAVD